MKLSARDTIQQQEIRSKSFRSI